MAVSGAAALVLARSTSWFASLGGEVSGTRLDRVRRSPQWDERRFRNSVPTLTMAPGSLPSMFQLHLRGGQVRRPRREIPVEWRCQSDYAEPPATGLRATWMGHATALLEIGGLRVLTDPVWSERVSPSSLAGPRRFFEPPITLDQLPAIDAALISHDHYDHLDMATVKALGARGIVFLVPLGVGAHLEKWGIPDVQIRELDWSERVTLDGVTFLMTPARHFSGRGVLRRDPTLWSSWVIATAHHRVFFCGDSGYFSGFLDIGRDHGPFDLTLISTGAYSSAWPLIHQTPDEVIQAQLDLGGRLLLPIHWGTFNLAFHDWNEPAVRASAIAAERGVRLFVPRPGQMVEPLRLADLPRDDWWREA